MAFPLAPTIGDFHTEGGIEYVWAAPGVWEVNIDTDFVELTVAGVDPTAGDTAGVGAVWRNTSTSQAFQYEETGVGTYEWVRVYKSPSIQVGSNSTTQPGGTPLISGDLEIDDGGNTTANTLRYYDGASWTPVDTFYDNTTAGMTGDPRTSQEALDVLANRVAVLTKGLAFFGTYDADTDNVIFNYISGLSDGPLPPADASNKDSYLIVNVAGTPAAGPMTGIAMDRGDWVVSDGTDWTYLSVSTNINSFLELLDTPSSFAGQAGKVVRVNVAESSLEFIDPTDTHSIFAANAPAIRPSGDTLQVGDRWVDSDNFRPYSWDGSAWKPISPVIVSTAKPTQTTAGLLWYNPTIGTMFIYDDTAAKWVGI